MKKQLLGLGIMILFFGFTSCNDEQKKAEENLRKNMEIIIERQNLLQKKKDALKQKKQKTVKYINELIKGCSWYNSYNGKNYQIEQNISVNGCYLTMNVTESEKGSSMKDHDKRKVYLYDLDSYNFRIRYNNDCDVYYLGLMCKNGNQNMTYSGSDGRTYRSDYNYFTLKSESVAIKVKNAFKELINYCDTNTSEGIKQDKKKNIYNPCDNFSFKETMRSSPTDYNDWVNTTIWVECNNGKEYEITKSVIKGPSHITKYYYGNSSDKGSLYNAAKYACGCE